MSEIKAGVEADTLGVRDRLRYFRSSVAETLGNLVMSAKDLVVPVGVSAALGFPLAVAIDHSEQSDNCTPVHGEIAPTDPLTLDPADVTEPEVRILNEVWTPLEEAYAELEGSPAVAHEFIPDQNVPTDQLTYYGPDGTEVKLFMSAEGSGDVDQAYLLGLTIDESPQDSQADYGLSVSRNNGEIATSGTSSQGNLYYYDLTDSQQAITRAHDFVQQNLSRLPYDADC